MEVKSGEGTVVVADRNHCEVVQALGNKTA